MLCITGRARPALFVLITIIASLLLASCSTLGPHDEKPVVVLKGLSPLSGGTGTPGFEVTLGVINPGRNTLELYGVVYTISVQGHELVKGVGKDFDPIEGYSEGTIKLTAQPNLLAGIRMFTSMMNQSRNQPADRLEYEFEAKLDTGGWSVPIRIREVGYFSLSGTPGEP